MTHVTTTSHKPTVRRVLGGLVAATAVMIIQLWTATPAHADHSVTITHASPPAAIAGSDVPLVVAVDGCWIFCNAITLETTYWTEDSRKRTIIKSLGSFRPEIAVIVIPGRHIVKPTLSYFLRASQDYCWLGDPCHRAEARLPESGSYPVRVL